MDQDILPSEHEELLKSEEDQDAGPTPEEIQAEYEWDEPDDDEDEGEKLADDDPAGEGKEKSAEEEAGETAELLSRAKDLGLTEDEISVFADNPAALSKTLDLLEKKREGGGGEEEKGKAAAEEGDEEEIPFPELDPELYDEPIVKGFQVAKVELARLRAQVKQMTVQNYAMWLDAEFSELTDGEEGYAEVFGKGPARKLDRAGEPYKNRQKVVAEIDALAAGMLQKGQELPSDDELLAKAIRSALGDRLDEAKNKANHKKLQDRRRSTFTNRPTQRQSSSDQRLTPDQRAQRLVREKLRAARVEADDGDDGTY